MKNLFDKSNITLFMLKSLGFEKREELFENLYLKAFVDSFKRLKVEGKLEEKIRDAFVRDLETKNPLTKELIQDQFLFLNWEKWIHVSDTEKSRADICFSISGFEFVIECKRLKAAETAYLEEGIKRFVEGKYAQKDNFAGMIGFIIEGDPSSIIQKLKTKVKDFHPTEDIDVFLEKSCADYEFSFQSKHQRQTGTPIQLFHLFFDWR